MTELVPVALAGFVASLVDGARRPASLTSTRPPDFSPKPGSTAFRDSGQRAFAFDPTTFTETILAFTTIHDRAPALGDRSP